MPTPNRGYPNDLTSDSPNTPHLHINALAAAVDSDVQNIIDGTARIKATSYTFSGGVSSNGSALVDVPHNFGSTPDTVIVQVVTNARLVVAVNAFDATIARLEFFNPSPSNSSSSCKVHVISIKKTA